MSLDKFFGEGNDFDLASRPDDERATIESWRSRWELGRGPAFLPRNHDQSVSWYGLMENAPQRREIEVLLRHWVGPACSDVYDRRGSLDATDAFDAWLMSEFPGRVVRLDVVAPANGNTAGAEQTVLRRLARLTSLIDRRPVHQHRENASLGAALDDVYLRAAEGDGEGALELVRALERRRILDSPNNAFVRLRVLALAGRDEDLVASPDLRELQGQRIPRGLTIALQQAVERLLSSGRLAEDSLEAHVVALLRRPGPTEPTVPVDESPREATADATKANAPTAKTPEPGPPVESPGHVDVDSGPAAPTPPQVAVPVDQTDGPASVLDGAAAMKLWMENHAALIEAVDTTDCPQEVLEFAIFAAEAFGDRSAADRVLQAVEFRAAQDDATWRLPGIEAAITSLRIVRDGQVSSWADWFEATSTGRAPEAGVLESAIDWDPLPPDEVVDRIRSIDEDMLGRALGSFLAVHYELMEQRDVGRVAARMIAALALSSRAGRDSRAWTLLLVGDAVEADLPPEDRVQVLTAAELIVSQHVTGSTIPWLIDLVGEVAGAWSVLESEDVESLVYEALKALRQVRASITRGDVRLLEVALNPSSVALPGDLHSHLTDVEEADPLACLAGKRILIYSLRESSARQAAARLNQVPGIDVVLSHAHEGSTQLAGQVAGVDIVAMVTTAAKHAATNFIEEHVTGTLLHVNTSGASGLLAALAATCA